MMYISYIYVFMCMICIYFFDICVYVYVYIYIGVFSLGGGVSPTQNHQLNQLPFKVDNG